MTSAIFDLEAGLGASKRDENISVEMAGGITWETDIGRCCEKKDATCMSGLICLFSVDSSARVYEHIPRGWIRCVEGTLGRLRCVFSKSLVGVSWTGSFTFRFRVRGLEALSTSDGATGVASSTGTFAVVVIALASDLGGLGVFEDECFL